MDKITNDPKFENSFSELLPLLRQYEISPELSSTHARDKDDVQTLQQVDNAIHVLLVGLSDLSHLIHVVAQKRKRIIEDLDKLRFFISTILNLTDALNTLRLETSCPLDKS